MARIVNTAAAQIASGNMMRVMREVEAYAAQHRGEAPLESPVAD